MTFVMLLKSIARGHCIAELMKGAYAPFLHSMILFENFG